MTKLGQVLPDGQILLYDENIKFREAMTGHYRRRRHTPEQMYYLSQQGYQHVLSSFISAIATKDNDLFVRFHNGSVYRYSNFSWAYDEILQANSKGQYFNRRIRPTKNYEKIDSLPFPTDYKLEDQEMFAALDIDYIKKIAQALVGAEILTQNIVREGVNFVKYQIGDITFYRPVKSVN